MTPQPSAAPSPEKILETLFAYRSTAALRSAIQLDVFTGIGEGVNTSPALAARSATSEKGMRVLCDALVVLGFLTKGGTTYSLTPDSKVFLDRKSPACMASVSDFLVSDHMVTDSLTLADCVRKGGTLLPGDGSVERDNKMWVVFARAMAPMMAMAAHAIAEVVPGVGPLSVLDIAAGHGAFGIAIAKRNTQAKIVALDWEAVLEVAKENAEKAGISDRYSTIPGSAFEEDFGTGHDIVLVTNFLHHFDQKTNEEFMRKVLAALKPGGKAITLEFCPDESRTSPPTPALFALTMLQETPSGDAYTFHELDTMCRNAGFGPSQDIRLPNGQSIIVSPKH